MCILEKLGEFRFRYNVVESRSISHKSIKCRQTHAKFDGVTSPHPTLPKKTCQVLSGHSPNIGLSVLLFFR